LLGGWRKSSQLHFAVNYNVGPDYICQVSSCLVGDFQLIAEI